MKAHIIARAKRGHDTIDRQNRLREELHHLILQETDRTGGTRQLCFVGGTALRILYGLDRYSEDLDFSAAASVETPLDFGTLVKAIQTSLVGFGFGCQLAKLKVEGAVHSCFFTFTELLHPVDRSFNPTQKLAIKFEVDTRPPAGGIERVDPVTGLRVYKLRHYDLSSLFAGKLHAILYRTYTKGRDLYDFLWYMGRNDIAVNGTLLHNAILQTQGNAPQLTNENLRTLLTKRFDTIDFAAAKKDVTPFLTDRAALELFEKEVFLNAVQKVKLDKTLTP